MSKGFAFFPTGIHVYVIWSTRTIDTRPSEKSQSGNCLHRTYIFYSLFMFEKFKVYQSILNCNIIISMLTSPDEYILVGLIM